MREAFADVLDSIPDAKWGGGRHFVLSDDYGVSEWRLTGTKPDDTHLDVLGCDFLTIRDREDPSQELLPQTVTCGLTSVLERVGPDHVPGRGREPAELP